jgi:serine/threonine protein kinase
LKHKQRLLVAAADIVREGHFLAKLRHLNIITLRGYGPLDDISHYYLLIDKIETPLSARIDDWGLATVENDQIYERLVYAMSIARAMSYLHSLNIVYRDLKIDNLGLDANGQIMLYDFGLAKELKGPHENGKYKLSGNTGSWAYMAPEVAKGYKYNLSVDVYSYGILLWELLSGKYASEGNWNLDKEGRPPFLRTWPQALEALITHCWHWNPNNRPTFVQIEEQLDAIMVELRPNHTASGGSSFFSRIIEETTKMFR